MDTFYNHVMHETQFISVIIADDEDMLPTSTNDLCGSRSAELVVQDLLDLVYLLQECEAAKVVQGEVLYRGKMQD